MVTRVILTVLLCELAFGNTEVHNPLSDEFINLINSKQNSWKAGRNFSPHTPLTNIKRLIGASHNAEDHSEKLPRVEHDAEKIATLPEQFDPRDKWPNCPTLNEIRDQGSCASSWAFAPVEAMTDRYCIYSNGTRHFYFSAQDVISCCYTCIVHTGCNFGIGLLAWYYWVNTGIVSGGNYNSSQGCAPYLIPPCEHHNTTGKLPDCGAKPYTPVCKSSCDPKYNVDYIKDKQLGKSCYMLSTIEGHIRAELFDNGPVSTVMTVYEDFLHYKNGVYQHTQGNKLGQIEVKVLGWGVENGHKYWLAANSWNTDWGDKGFFKILRGENHCDIETLVGAGAPLYN